tara:strand:- start:976 stop:1533 length:558 start_codon:yes stop_codon:yes gene_type:complete
MKTLLPETYLIGLVGLLLVIAVLVGRQLIKVRSDEITLINLDKKNISNSNDVEKIYELASVQIRKRLYPQAISSLKQALLLLEDEPLEAKAVIENAMGFALAAQENFKEAIIHYKSAIKAKPEYPVAINNLAFAKQRLYQFQDALDLYTKALKIDPKNQTAQKQLEKIKKRSLVKIEDEKSSKGF